MARVSHLERRGAVYYARMDVPLDIVPFLKKQTLKRSLKTKDENEAKALLYPVLGEWTQMFEDIRARKPLTDASREHAVWDHYIATLASDEVARTTPIDEDRVKALTEATISTLAGREPATLDPLEALDATLEYQAITEAASLDALRRTAKLKDMRKQLGEGETALIAAAVNDYLRDHSLYAEPKSREWLSLARQMMRAEIEALQRTIERDSGTYGGQPSDPIVRPSAHQQSAVAQPGEKIMEVFELFAAENPRRVTPDRMNQIRRDIGIFVESVGATAPVKAIDKIAVRDWKALLIKYPVRATEVTDFQGLEIRQIVAKNEKLKREVLSDRSVNRYLSSLSAYCHWLVSNGYIIANPVSGMTLPKEKRAKTITFTPDQLNALFSSPLFTGAQSDKENRWSKIAKPGPIKIRNHLYWVPLIMLFSGARNGEIGQLATSDVRQLHDKWIFHITEDGEQTEQGKSVKTAGSARVLPIHPELIELGFLDYHAERVAAGDKQLFPGVTRNARGQIMADFSREFGKYLTRIGLKDGRGLSLYSFRHGVADALRRAGYLDNQFGFILGHTEASMTGRYGQMPQGMLDQRVSLINAIEYPGLNLDHLKKKHKLRT
ncbi:DUF6538 domain-containing protein [Arenibacterium sp. LLYu02]|uniref:DUF6538 domain-containing protein n=1 Tax=Arenibacterium sp. LLYu02 TaxID=3404132 RepID=UPI003B21382B